MRPSALAMLTMTIAVSVSVGCAEVAGPDGGTGATNSFTFLYGDYFGNCGRCHAPGAPGRTSDIEQNLDFTSKATAFTSITSRMSNVPMGNFTGCNGQRFVNADPSKALILAVLDESTRAAFDIGANCGMDDVSDETAKVASAPSATFVAGLKSWLQAGSPNN
jgi:hypothetical protein